MTRPRFCRTCHAPDVKNAVEVTLPWTHITIGASVQRGFVTRHIFYCDDHIEKGMLQ